MQRTVERSMTLRLAAGYPQHAVSAVCHVLGEARYLAEMLGAAEEDPTSNKSLQWTGQGNDQSESTLQSRCWCHSD